MKAVTVSTGTRHQCEENSVCHSYPRKWYDLQKQARETNASTVDMPEWKRFWNGIILEARMEDFGHMRFCHTDVDLEFFHIARVIYD